MRVLKIEFFPTEIRFHREISHDIPLETRSMRQYREKVLREREAEKEKQEKEKREKREERWRVIEAVKKIQGLYRMRKTRRLWYPVILNAQEARIAKERREGKATFRN